MTYLRFTANSAVCRTRLLGNHQMAACNIDGGATSLHLRCQMDCAFLKFRFGKVSGVNRSDSVMPRLHVKKSLVAFYLCYRGKRNNTPPTFGVILTKLK